MKFSLRRIVTITILVTISGVLFTLVGIAYNSNFRIFTDTDVSNWAALTVATGLGLFIAVIVKLASDRDISLIKQIIQDKQTFDNNQQNHVLKYVLQNVKSVYSDVIEIEKNIVNWKNESQKKPIERIILSDWNHAKDLITDLQNNHVLLLFFINSTILEKIQLLKELLIIEPYFNEVKDDYHIHKFDKIKECTHDILIYVKKELELNLNSDAKL